MTPERIIFDFDNTFGIDGCDIDDGLALLYALGHPQPHLAQSRPA
jgi:inosine-uridine nucleoside N-ribohydrolase